MRPEIMDGVPEEFFEVPTKKYCPCGHVLWKSFLKGNPIDLACMYCGYSVGIQPPEEGSE